MRTNELKKLIRSILLTVVDNCGFNEVPNDTLYPHIAFSFDRLNLDDFTRKDVLVELDIWDKGTDTTRIDDIADQVEDAFNAFNSPQEKILPTFYLQNRNYVKDDDKTIKHINMVIEVQNYERK